MKAKSKIQTVILILLLIVFSSFTLKKELPSIINYSQRFMAIDKNLYADKYEVRVADYQLFLREKKETNADCTLLMYDSTKWRDKLGYNEAIMAYYFHYRSYDNYPIICISYYAANEFCKWLTEKYNASPKNKFKKVIFRLPTEAEYKKAASSIYKPEIYYPWGHNGLYSKGQQRCNFLELSQDCLDFDGKNLNIHDDRIMESARLSPVDDYAPNPYGLYNMVGNVSEMIQEESYAMGGDWLSSGYNVRIQSKKKYDEPSKVVGFRVYMEIIEF